MPTIEKHYRRDELLALLGLSTSTLYRLMADDEFPRPLRLTGNIVAWPESVVSDWLDSRANPENI